MSWRPLASCSDLLILIRRNVYGRELGHETSAMFALELSSKENNLSDRRRQACRWTGPDLGSIKMLVTYLIFLLDVH